MSERFKHPEGKIELLDGRVLDCCPAQTPKKEVNNDLSLDGAGQYLSLKKDNSQNAPVSNEEEKMLDKMFLDNAFVFLENAERIMSDSRMFLCSLDFIRGGLAYTGRGGFENPTVGVFLEFWKTCPNASYTDENGVEWLTYYLAGSPLSGANRCGLVNRKGECLNDNINDLKNDRWAFRSIWPPFMEINRRYDEAKEKYVAYTLPQLLQTLKDEGVNVSL